MANITLVIPDAQLPRVIAALCAHPAPGMDPMPLPETGANAKAVVAAWIRHVVLNHELSLAEKAIVPPDVTGLAT